MWKETQSYLQVKEIQLKLASAKNVQSHVTEKPRSIYLGWFQVQLGPGA